MGKYWEKKGHFINCDFSNKLRTYEIVHRHKLDNFFKLIYHTLKPRGEQHEKSTQIYCMLHLTSSISTEIAWRQKLLSCISGCHLRQGRRKQKLSIANSHLKLIFLSSSKSITDGVRISAFMYSKSNSATHHRRGIRKTRRRRENLN